MSPRDALLGAIRATWSACGLTAILPSVGILPLCRNPRGRLGL